LSYLGLRLLNRCSGTLLQLFSKSISLPDLQSDPLVFVQKLIELSLGVSLLQLKLNFEFFQLIEPLKQFTVLSFNPFVLGDNVCVVFFTVTFLLFKLVHVLLEKLVLLDCLLSVTLQVF
jgi:hypothetical protein